MLVVERIARMVSIHIHAAEPQVRGGGSNAHLTRKRGNPRGQSALVAPYPMIVFFAVSLSLAVIASSAWLLVTFCHCAQRNRREWAAAKPSLSLAVTAGRGSRMR